MPDILILYHQTEHFHMLPLAGGLLDQPYQLMLELTQCRIGVERYQRALDLAARSQAAMDPQGETERMSRVLSMPGL